MKKNVYRTTTLVIALSVSERALGFLYRIALSRLIGAEGLGLYQLALSVFSVFVTIGTGGIPASVSKLVSKSKAEKLPQNESAALSAGLLCSLFSTLPVLVFFVLFKNVFVFLFSDLRAMTLFGVLLCGLVFTCLYAVIRGCFWGNKKFLLTSLLEIFEESVMVAVGILLLRKPSSPFLGAKKASVAVVVSYLASFTASLVCLIAYKKRISSPKNVLKPLLSSAVPVTAVRAGGSLISSAVAVLLPAALVRVGMTSSDALKVFGVVSGMVLPILSVPATFIGAISLVLSPELTENYYKKETNRLELNTERGILAAVLTACVLIVPFSVVGKELGLLLFSDASAGEMLSSSAFLLLPMSLTMITTGILNSIGCEKQTLVYYFIGAPFMLACVLFLPAFLGAYAYLAGLAVSYVITAILNLACLHKRMRFSQNFAKRLLVSILSSLPAIVFGKVLLPVLNSFFSSFAAVTLSASLSVVFALSCYLLVGAISLKPIFKKANT